MAKPAAFDPDPSRRMTWQRAAAERQGWDATLQAWLGPLTRIMRAHTRCGPNERVLVLAPDVLADVDRAVQEDDLTTPQNQIVEGEYRTLANSAYDAVLSLAWLRSCPDRQRDLGEVRRILKPGGQIAVAVYGAQERNDFLAIPVGILRRAAQVRPPAPGQLDPFRLGEPGMLGEALREAGFTDIDVRVVHAPIRLPSAVECARFLREALGAFHGPIANLPPDEQSAIWEEIALALRRFESNCVFVAPCELLVGVGMK